MADFVQAAKVMSPDGLVFLEIPLKTEAEELTRRSAKLKFFASPIKLNSELITLCICSAVC